MGFSPPGSWLYLVDWWSDATWSIDKWAVGIHSMGGNTDYNNQPVNGSVTTEVTADLKGYYTWEYHDASGQKANPPAGSPMPTTMPLLVRDTVWASCWLGTGEPSDTEALAVAWNSLGDTAVSQLVNETMLLDSGGGNAEFHYHVLQVPVNATTGVATVEVTGTMDTDFANEDVWTGDNPVFINCLSEMSVAAKPNVGSLTGSYINKDDPANVTYASLPSPRVLYGGSVPSTSDILLLDASDPDPIPGTTYTWSVLGGAGFTPPAGTASSIWNVGAIPPSPGIVTFVCKVQAPGTSPVLKLLSVEIGIRTDDVIMIGWIDATGVTLNSAGVNSQVLADMPADGGVSPNPAAAARIGALAQNDDCVDFASLSPSQVYTPTDKDYILSWMFKYAPNPNPQQDVLPYLETPDATDPTGVSTTNDFTTHAGYMDYPKFNAYLQDSHRFKLLNHFQVKYRVNFANPTQFNGSPTILQQGAYIGATVNPTGLPPDFGPVLDTLLQLPPSVLEPLDYILLITAAYTNHTLLDPQAGPANGVIGPVPATDHISQINDGSPDVPGIRAFNTLMGLDVATPLFWQNIGSKITFKCGSALPIATPENYPTYYRYQNGIRTWVYPQFFTPKGHFYANPYPFGTAPSYGLPPQVPGDIPLIPGLPAFPTINGGRNGFATLPAEDSVPIPPYTAP